MINCLTALIYIYILYKWGFRRFRNISRYSFIEFSLRHLAECVFARLATRYDKWKYSRNINVQTLTPLLTGLVIYSDHLNCFWALKKEEKCAPYRHASGITGWYIRPLKYSMPINYRLRFWEQTLQTSPTIFQGVSNADCCTITCFNFHADLEWMMYSMVTHCSVIV